MKNLSYVFVTIGTAIFTAVCIYFSTVVISNRAQKTYTQIMFDISDPFTQDKVQQYLKYLNVKYPEVALAQMKLESANGTSSMFRENNNLFGMKKAVHRTTLGQGNANDYVYFKSIEESIGEN